MGESELRKKECNGDIQERTGRYNGLIEKLIQWGNRDVRVYLALIIGSQARSDHPADEFSDLDVIIAVDDSRYFMESNEWLEAIGTYYITFNERTVNGDDEKRVLFEEALDVDFVILSRERLEYAVKNNELEILKRGYRVLIDKIGIGAEALPLADDKPVPVILSERDYTNIVNDFWYHAVWAKKKLLRGELWMAKSCIDNYMKGLLFKIVECHAHAINGPDYDTWHGGRFFDEWAGDWIVERLSSCYSYYETGDAERALSSTMDLFRDVAVETADRMEYRYPAEADSYAAGWVLQRNERKASE